VAPSSGIDHQRSAKVAAIDRSDAANVLDDAGEHGLIEPWSLHRFGLMLSDVRSLLQASGPSDVKTLSLDVPERGLDTDWFVHARAWTPHETPIAWCDKERSTVMNSRNRRNPALELQGWTVALVASILLCGCKTNEGSTGSSSSGDAATAAEVEQRHVIGPAAASEVNYRVDWQYLGAGENLKHLSVQGDSVFALDERNFLTRIKMSDGGRLWRAAVAEPVEEVLGVTFAGDRTYITTGSAILLLDSATGSQIGRQRIDKIASTAPAVYDRFLVYGSRNGQIVWHAPLVGSHWRSYQVSNSIEFQPVLADSYLVAVGNGGVVMVLSAASATGFWSKTLLGEIVAPPAVGQGLVYIAGRDQYLWAFDIASGRNLWKVLMENPLTEGPVLIGERVYQQVPGRGLACFNAVPIDSPGGERIWQSAGVKGNVITQRGDVLMAWDATSRQLNLVEAARGSLIKSVNVPQAQNLIVSGEKGDEIYAASRDGRVVRLVPRT
jgi:outer membrane protein assembly factor BamB